MWWFLITAFRSSVYQVFVTWYINSTISYLVFLVFYTRTWYIFFVISCFCHGIPIYFLTNVNVAFFFLVLRCLKWEASHPPSSRGNAPTKNRTQPMHFSQVDGTVINSFFLLLLLWMNPERQFSCFFGQECGQAKDTNDMASIRVGDEMRWHGMGWHGMTYYIHQQYTYLVVLFLAVACCWWWYIW